MSLKYLTGATSGIEYKISGFSAYPSFGPLIKARNNFAYPGAINETGPDNALANRIWSEQDGYYGGLGLYANYHNNKYYWYLFSVTKEACGDPSERVTFEVYNLDGSSTQEDEQSDGYPKLYCSFQGQDFYEIDNGTLTSEFDYGDIYIAPRAKVGESSSVGSNWSYGASLAFWPFLNNQKYDTCFIKGSKVKLANGSYKNIEDVVPGDEVPYITDAGLPSTTTVVAPPHHGTCTEYTNYFFEDGTVLPIYRDQGIWCEEKKAYVTILEWEIGWTTKKTDGTLTKLIAKEVVKKPEGAEDFEHYFLYTYNGNYSVNDVLTCTDRIRALNAYLDEIRHGSTFVLPDYKITKWKREIAIREHKIHPLRSIAYKEIVKTIKKEIEANNSLINQDKKNLDNTDYKIQKYLEGVLSEEEYIAIKAQRQEWRNNINILEATNIELNNQIVIFTRKFEMKPTHPDYPSIAPDTQILMADGTTKALKDIKVGDEVLYLTDDKTQVKSNKVVLPVEPEYVWDYKIYKLSDGTELKLHNSTNLFCIEHNKYCPTRELTIGSVIRKFDGSEVTIESITPVTLDHEEIFYRISTRNGNFVINNVLALVSFIRVYDELMWEENEPFRLSDEEMEEWKNQCDALR